MKHIQLFEGWDQTELDFKMTPEQFQQAIADAMQSKSPADAMRYLKKVIDDNPHLKNDPTSLKALAPLVNSLTDDDRMVLKNEFNPAGAEARMKSVAKIQAASDLLDAFESGQIGREDFVRRIAGVS
jgi:hypothetical protein